MRFNKHQFWMMVTFFCLMLLFHSNTVEAKKYYSLKEIGLSGCATDKVDYAVFSIRGNKIKYAIYKFSPKNCEWERAGGVKTAKLTSKTKYYMGDPKRVSASLKKHKEDGKNKEIRPDNKKDKAADNRRRFAKKDINTEKWIYRVRKGTVKKNIFSRNNEIQVKNGEVTKLIVRLVY